MGSNQEQNQGHKYYVGNLSYHVREEELKKLFEDLSGVDIVDVKIIRDKDTDRSKGFGFVEINLTGDKDSSYVVEHFNDMNFEGRAIKVSKAREGESRTRSGGSYGGGSYGGGSYGGNQNRDNHGNRGY